MERLPNNLCHGSEMCIRDRHKGINGEVEIQRDMRDHNDAIHMVLEALLNRAHGVVSDLSEIGAVGHRVVHGGESFSASVLIDVSALVAIENNIDLAPLHNPANIMGIKACVAAMPGTPVSYTHLDVYKRQDSLHIEYRREGTAGGTPDHPAQRRKGRPGPG